MRDVYSLLAFMCMVAAWSITLTGEKRVLIEVLRWLTAVGAVSCLLYNLYRMFR